MRSPWFDSLIIGSQFLYSEGGAQTVVRLVHKEVRQDSGTELVALTLEAVYPVRYGIYKEIEPGEVWDVSALLGNTGFPNAFSPWHVAPVPENVSERIDLVPRSERFAKPRNIAPQQRRAMLNALREVNGETVQLHLHSQDTEAATFFSQIVDLFTKAGLRVRATNIIEASIPFSHGMATSELGRPRSAEAVRRAGGRLPRAQSICWF